MLNQAAQKFIFMLEKITMGLGGTRAPSRSAPAGIYPEFSGDITNLKTKLAYFLRTFPLV